MSELASLMKELSALQQSDPAKFKQVTADVAKQLQAAAKTAAANGDSQGSEALNNLASKFTTASETGKMPHLRHHHGSAPPPDSDSTSTASTDSSTSTADKLQSLLSIFQQGSTDPLSTLTSILSSAMNSQQT